MSLGQAKNKSASQQDGRRTERLSRLRAERGIGEKPAESAAYGVVCVPAETWAKLCAPLFISGFLRRHDVRRVRSIGDVSGRK